jgi:hypothetical protein
MPSPLKTYRVYSYGRTHEVLTADLVEATNDDEAVAKAEAAGIGSKYEIWEDRRLVAQLYDQRRLG